MTNIGMKKWVVPLAASAALFAGVAHAQDAQVSGAHRHDGLLLRLDLGAGYSNSSASDQDASVHGGAAAFGIAVGGTVAENFVLGGHLWIVGLPSPTFSQGGTSVTPDNTTASEGALGLEADYYFMPANVYLSGTLGLSNLSVQVGGVSAKTNVGPAGQIALGKEWWVSDDWGLGLAGQFSFSFNKDSDTSSTTWNTVSAAVVFSATYN